MLLFQPHGADANQQIRWDRTALAGEQVQGNANSFTQESMAIVLQWTKDGNQIPFFSSFVGGEWNKYGCPRLERAMQLLHQAAVAYRWKRGPSTPNGRLELNLPETLQRGVLESIAVARYQYLLESKRVPEALSACIDILSFIRDQALVGPIPGTADILGGVPPQLIQTILQRKSLVLFSMSDLQKLADALDVLDQELARCPPWAQLELSQTAKALSMLNDLSNETPELFLEPESLTTQDRIRAGFQTKGLLASSFRASRNIHSLYQECFGVSWLRVQERLNESQQFVGHEWPGARLAWMLNDELPLRLGLLAWTRMARIGLNAMLDKEDLDLEDPFGGQLNTKRRGSMLTVQSCGFGRARNIQMEFWLVD